MHPVYAILKVIFSLALVINIQNNLGQVLDLFLNVCKKAHGRHVCGMF